MKSPARLSPTRRGEGRWRKGRMKRQVDRTTKLTRNNPRICRLFGHADHLPIGTAPKKAPTLRPPPPRLGPFLSAPDFDWDTQSKAQRPAQSGVFANIRPAERFDFAVDGSRPRSKTTSRSALIQTRSASGRDESFADISPKAPRFI